jgi:lactaldehyde dehydrogenase
VPFNYPVELWGHKAAAALAAGNALISKPPSACPLTLLKIAALMEECGFPPYAHQMVTGPGAVIGDFLARSDGIQLVTVTGSTEVGIRIAQLGAEHLKKVHMELGGNDALIILSDCDIEKAAEAVVLGRLARGNGQICCAVKRIFVEAPIHDQFADLLTQKARALKMGDQLQEDTDVGPLINEQAAKEVETFVNGAIKAGATLRTGGHRQVAFYEPTVLTNVQPDMVMFKEEVFGPVAPLVQRGIEDPIPMANDSPTVFSHGLPRYQQPFRLQT